MTSRPTGASIAAVLIGLASAVASASSGGEATATYYKDVLPIIQENCQTCHRPGGRNLSGLVAPMSFMTYEETRPWARAIERKVEAREMPPWFASAPKGVFANERGLTDPEIRTIVEWVEAGAPSGDVADAPPARLFPDEAHDGWVHGRPDVVVRTMKQPVTTRQPGNRSPLTARTVVTGRPIS